jgi:UDP-glucose:(heptosyl)LPS alpha-1,3-glucosyltransferase
MKSLNLLFIVRHFGPVGGMERYVWELTRQLADMGHVLTILCETLEAEKPEHIQIVQLGEIRIRHRWLRHLIFSHRVSTWVAAHPEEDRIIHSHERTGVHQFTTFHGPPFASVKNKPLWQRISPRKLINMWLERREVCASGVKAVIPNSALIADALHHYYPDIDKRLTNPITPGVAAIPPRPDRLVGNDVGVIGFVGKEWKRKGLDIAARIIAELRQQRPNLQFLVAGPDPDEIRHLFQGWDGGFQLLGETDSTPLYAQFDLLLHPARAEPYGMVIAEARAAGVPVLVSSNCGIAPELNEDSILDQDATISAWSRRCDVLIGQQPEVVARSWKNVAEEQICCYQKFLSDR